MRCPGPCIGETLCAAVVFTGAPLSLAQINAHLDERELAVHARPDMLVAMAALPATPIGKIDERALAHRLTRPGKQND